MSVTGLDPNTQLGASGREGRVMTPSEVATILTTVMVFLLIVSIIFYCRYLASRRRDHAEAARKADEDFGHGFYKLEDVCRPEPADPVQHPTPAHIPEVGFTSTAAPERLTPEASMYASPVQQRNPTWRTLLGQTNARSDSMRSDEAALTV